MGIESTVGMTAVLLAMFGGVIAAEPQPCRRSPLPANVDLPRDLEPAIWLIYDRSPAFRAQCDRIAEAGHLRITVRIDPTIPYRCRAFTVVQRRRGQIRAQVHLRPSSDHAELLAHEFEHLLEQIEGIDIRRLSRVKGSGVREVEREMFETDRAQAAGRVVADQAGRYSRAPAAD
jgi:hypothetical protein